MRGPERRARQPLKTGAQHPFLDAVSGRLRAAGLTPSKSSSELARILADSAGPTTEAVPDKTSSVGKATAGAVVLAYLRGEVDQLVRHDRGARSDEPDAVHQMRIASRRLRSALATYRPLQDRGRADPLCEELKWLGQVLGRA